MVEKPVPLIIISSPPATPEVAGETEEITGFAVEATKVIWAGASRAPPPEEAIRFRSTAPIVASAGTMARTLELLTLTTYGDFCPLIITVGVPDKPKLVPSMVIIDPPEFETELGETEVKVGLSE